ncbi:MAG TPA: hypothetical protein QF665_00720 [Alphaproteobacteria bacterium]|jgi:hypothetical protein|nr:hypothetical protein [Alphaproteobacteria bacterium]
MRPPEKGDAMKAIDRILLGVIAAGLWTAVALYAFSPQPVTAHQPLGYPESIEDLEWFIWSVVETDCFAMNDGKIICSY